MGARRQSALLLAPPTATGWRRLAALPRGRGHAGLTASRDSIDEEVAAAPAARPHQQQQHDHPHALLTPLALLEPAALRRLTELGGPDNVYTTGVVGSAEELARRLGTSMMQGLCEDGAALSARAARYGANSVAPPQQATLLQLVVEALQVRCVRVCECVCAGAREG